MLLALCFLLSGFAALVYQTAWTRQFALVFGTSELAVATVLAAYMGGLALGAWLVEKLLPRISRPVLTYAALELGIAASAIAWVPALIFAADGLLRSLFGAQPSPPDSSQTDTTVFYLASAFVVLAIPTVLMGATLPLLARNAVRTDREVGGRIGLLYTFNTLGAVAGALASAFWLLPQYGLRQTVLVAALFNVAVFAIAALLSRQRSRWIGRSTPIAVSRGGLFRDLLHLPHASWVLPLMLVSGAVSFFHEVLWTRMLSHVLGSSLHAFAVMLASFLAGIALGGGAGALLARSRGWAVPSFASCQIGIALTAAGAFLLMEQFIPPPQTLATTAAYGAAILLPLTFFIGATYPLAVRILAEGAKDAASSSARIYAWNTVGAIAGALLAGFIVIPRLRFEGAIQVAVWASCALALAAAWMLARTARAFGVVVLVASLAIAVSFRPGIPERLLRTSPLDIANDGRMLYYDVGRSASVVVLEQDGALVLRTNGLPEAMMEMRGTPPRVSGESWLSPLAVVARPDIQNMLIVGYGGGVVVEAIPPTVQQVDVIEIEPLVIAANRHIRADRKRDPLADPRVRIIQNDARGALRLTERRYDAIVSQPSHPWTAGASHLYTLEFMRQARQHLTDDGVFVQWMNVTFLDEALLRSLAATLVEAFGQVRLYRPDPTTLIFLASAKPLDLELRLAETGRPLSDAPEHYARLGINTVEDLLTALAVDADGAHDLAADAKPIIDDTNRLATSGLHDFGHALDAHAAGEILAPLDPLSDPKSWVFRRLRNRVSFPYVARRLALFAPIDASVGERIAAISQALIGTEPGYAVQSTLLSVRGALDESRQIAREGVARFPDSQPLRFLYLRPWMGALSRSAASPEIARSAKLLEGPAAAILRANTLAQEEDWDAVAAMDPILADIPWTAPWKLDAVQLRADWRSRLASSEARSEAGDECIEIVDAAIVVQPNLALYGLRARCALASRRFEALIESLWSLGRGTYNNALKLPPEQRFTARRNLETIAAALEKNVPAEGAEGVDPARRDEVLARLQGYARALD